MSEYTVNKQSIFTSEEEKAFIDAVNKNAVSFAEATHTEPKLFDNVGEFFDTAFMNFPSAVEKLFEKQVKCIRDLKNTAKGINIAYADMTDEEKQTMYKVMSAFLSALNLNNITLMHINDTLQIGILDLARSKK